MRTPDLPREAFSTAAVDALSPADVVFGLDTTAPRSSDEDLFSYRRDELDALFSTLPAPACFGDAPPAACLP